MKEINNIVRPELLAPAGNLEKLQFAYQYGADAVYIGSEQFSLRSGVEFSVTDIEKAKNIAYRLKKKLFIAVNAFAHNEDIAQLEQYLTTLKTIEPGAVIVSDPGVFVLCKEILPEIPIHISTQANNTNYLTASFWAKQGAKRIVLARELSLREAGEIAQKNIIETEVFVHGAMCISYSGRCLISKFLTNRSANKGTCSHPCRWSYALQEEQRPGEYFPIMEDQRGSYIMNSKDLCLIDHVPELIKQGITSWKIEGRQKSSYYIANTVRIYKAAMNAYYAGVFDQEHQDAFSCELRTVSHRAYTTGFAVSEPEEDSIRHEDGGYLRSCDFVAIARGIQDGHLLLEQRNHFKRGDTLQILLTDVSNRDLFVEKIFDENNLEIDAARHPHQMVKVPIEKNDLPNLDWPLVCRKQIQKL